MIKAAVFALTAATSIVQIMWVHLAVPPTRTVWGAFAVRARLISASRKVAQAISAVLTVTAKMGFRAQLDSVPPLEIPARPVI
jgi:hypothetical protein